MSFALDAKEGAPHPLHGPEAERSHSSSTLAVLGNYQLIPRTTSSISISFVMSAAYTRVAQHECSSSSDKFEPLLIGDEDQISTRVTQTKLHHAAWMLNPAWMYSTFALLVLLLAQNAFIWSTPSYERGYPTELGSTFPPYPVRHVTY